MASKKAKGKRSKTRSLFKRRNIPKLTVNKLVQDFAKGQRIVIKVDPSFHSGMPTKRYQGKSGTVVGKQGKVFDVEVKKGTMTKHLLVAPAHLMPVKLDGGKL